MSASTLPTHPFTGLRALGLRRNGSPIWPIRGASEDDASAGEAAGTGDDAGTSDGAPAGGSGDDVAAELKKWKDLARKHEDRAKENFDKAKKYDALEESQKSEIQKATDKATAAEERAAQAEAEAARLRAAVKHGLSDEDLDLLGTHGTAEEIEARAELLAARLKTVAPAKPSAPPATGQGNVGGGVNDGKGQLTRDQLKGMTPEQINDARKEGRLNDLLGIQTTT